MIILELLILAIILIILFYLGMSAIIAITGLFGVIMFQETHNWLYLFFTLFSMGLLMKLS